MKDKATFIDQHYNFQGNKLQGIIEYDTLLFQLNQGFHYFKDESLSAILTPERFWKLDKNLFKIQQENGFRIQHITPNTSITSSSSSPNELQFLDESKVLFFKNFSDQNYSLLESVDSFYIFHNGKVKFRELKTSLGFRAIKTALIDSQNRIWIGSSANGIHLFQPKVFKSISELNTKWKINGHMVYLAPDSNIWFDGGCGKLINRNNKTNELSETLVQGCPWTVLQTSNGDFWINGVNKTQDVPLHHYDPSNKIGNALIYSSFEYNDHVFLGTAKGIFYLEAQEFKRVPGTENIKATYQFFENKNGNLIFSSNEGIGVINGKELIRLFYTKDGLKPKDDRAVYEDSMGY